MTHFPSEQLHTLAAVVDRGTFDAAATALRVTPSAVSQRIRALERSSGRVLVRRSNPVQATEAGLVLLRLARQLAQLEADTARELGQGPSESGMPRGKPPLVSVPLVVNADSLAVWFLHALAAMPETLRATFDLHRDDEQYSTDLLRSGAVMAAVTASPDPVQGCRVERLGTMRYLAVATEEFAERWRDRTGKSLDWLAAAPRVDFDRKDTYQESFLAKLLPDSTAPRVGHFIPASTQFADAVRLGLGWSLLPEAQCRADLRSGHLVELAPKLPHDVDLYWQRWSIPSPILDTVGAVVGATAAKFLR